MASPHRQLLRRFGPVSTSCSRRRAHHVAPTSGVIENVFSRTSRWAAVAAVVSIVAGCHSEQVRTHPLPTAVVAEVREDLPEVLRQSAIDEKEGISYKIGPGDSLLITVFRHPEFTIQPVPQATVKPGTIVDNDGTIQLPLLGAVHVAGHTADEVRHLLQESLVRFVPDPQVTVQVLFNGSLRYYLVGEFIQPGVKYSDRPVSLMEGVALGGSIDLVHADLRGAYVARNGKKLPIDLYRLLRSGDLRQNIRLHSGDTIFVPDNANQFVYVFGGATKGAQIPLVNGHLGLLQALASAGFNYTDHSQGKFETVRIIRGEADRATFFVVNAENILKGKAAPFMLESGDLVFVPETAWTKWNQILQQFLPSLQTISGLLSPFVEIKYLGGF